MSERHLRIEEVNRKKQIQKIKEGKGGNRRKIKEGKRTEKVNKHTLFHYHYNTKRKSKRERKPN